MTGQTLNILSPLPPPVALARIEEAIVAIRATHKAMTRNERYLEEDMVVVSGHRYGNYLFLSVRHTKISGRRARLTGEVAAHAAGGSELRGTMDHPTYWKGFWAVWFSLVIVAAIGLVTIAALDFRSLTPSQAIPMLMPFGLLGFGLLLRACFNEMLRRDRQIVLEWLTQLLDVSADR